MPLCQTCHVGFLCLVECFVKLLWLQILSSVAVKQIHVTLRWQCFPKPKILQSSSISCCTMNGNILNRWISPIFSFLAIKSVTLFLHFPLCDLFFALEAPLPFCLLNSCLLDWYVTLPRPSLFPVCLLRELWHSTSQRVSNAVWRNHL